MGAGFEGSATFLILAMIFTVTQQTGRFQIPGNHSLTVQISIGSLKAIILPSPETFLLNDLISRQRVDGTKTTRILDFHIQKVAVQNIGHFF